MSSNSFTFFSRVKTQKDTDVVIAQFSTKTGSRGNCWPFTLDGARLLNPPWARLSLEISVQYQMKVIHISSPNCGRPQIRLFPNVPFRFQSLMISLSFRQLSLMPTTFQLFSVFNIFAVNHGNRAIYFNIFYIFVLDECIFLMLSYLEYYWVVCINLLCS